MMTKFMHSEGRSSLKSEHSIDWIVVCGIMGKT